MKMLISIFIYLFSLQAFGYLHNQTTSGINVHWPTNVTTIDIYVNSQNSSGLNESSIQSIAGNSAIQWNGYSRLNLRKNSTAGKNQTNLNEVYFSDDPNYFNGSGVLGVTQVSYKQDTGVILEADVLINDSGSFFSLISSNESFLGNVITHELGHLLGLGHGQVIGSTMFYVLSMGQYQLSSDDQAGMYSTYPLADSTKKTISGKVVGGNNLIPVFGAQVEAISLKTGQVTAAGISDVNGGFSIEGLPINDQYFLYTRALTTTGLPSNYANVKSDFCESSRNYRGSFYQTCGASGEGYPAAISLSNANVDVGSITIRCGLDVPPDYMQHKGYTSSIYSLTSIENSKIGNAFVGYFSNQELTQAPITPDLFKINLSALTNTDWSTISTGALYLEVKILNQVFYSPYKNGVVIRRPSTTLYPVAVSPQSDGFLNLDIVSRIAIDRSTLSENDFTIQITPQTNVLNLSSYFPGFSTTSASSVFQDNLYFYLATASLVTSNDGGLTFTPASSRNYQLSDNTRCPDAMNTYAITNYNARGIASSTERKNTLACGSIDISDNNGNGPKGFFIGLFLTYILSQLFSFLKHRFSTRF